jgi:hypothetical protein
MILKKLGQSFGFNLVGVKSISGVKDVPVLVHAKNDFVVFDLIFNYIVV